MIQILKKFLRFPKSVNYKELIMQGALIIDVRSRYEYKTGHIINSINIPVDQLDVNMDKLVDKEIPIVICCSSGVRSAKAKNLLKSFGFRNTHNAGSWRKLRYQISR